MTESRIFALMCFGVSLGVGTSIFMSSNLVRGITAAGLAILGLGVLLGSVKYK